MLPAAVLVLPVVRNVPTSESAAAGWAALAAIPVAALLVFRRIELRVHALPLLLLPIALAVYGGSTASDTFSAERALLVLLTGLTCLLSGASLGSVGRRVLARGMVLCSLGWMGGALLDGFLAPQRGWVGVLENTGETSEAAMLGALVGLGLCAVEKGAARWISLLAAIAYLVHATTVPVHAGALSFGLAALAALLVPWKRNLATSGFSAILGVLLLLAAMVGGRAALGSLPGREVTRAAAQESAEETAAPEGAGAPHTSALEPSPGGDSAPQPGASSTGGFGVRTAIWNTLPAMMIADSGRLLLGVGPGQFAAAYPPWRDLDEIELSTQGRLAPTPTEVEHAHDDWLEAFVEYGLIGGLGFLLFWMLAAARGISALRGEDGLRAACGVALLGVTINAFFNSPLLFNAAASAQACALAGVLLGRTRAAQNPTRASLGLRLLALALLGVHAPEALAFVRHGQALGQLAELQLIEVSGSTGQRAKDVEPWISAALEQRADSVAALLKRSQLEGAQNLQDKRTITWRRILNLRPHHFEALVGLGNAYARDGRFAEADEQYAAAAALDAGHPQLLRNRLRLALDRGKPEAVASALTRADEWGVLEPAWIAANARRELLAGRLHLGLPLFQRLDIDALIAGAASASSPGAGKVETVVNSGFAALELAQRLAATHRDLSDALKATANQLWAREHISDKLPEVAVRSYRQSLGQSAQHIPGGARRVRIELTAALLQAGREADARAEYESIEPTAQELAEIPEWVGTELLRSGLLGS